MSQLQPPAVSVLASAVSGPAALTPADPFAPFGPAVSAVSGVSGDRAGHGPGPGHGPGAGAGGGAGVGLGVVHRDADQRCTPGPWVHGLAAMLLLTNPLLPHVLRGQADPVAVLAARLAGHRPAAAVEQCAGPVMWPALAHLVVTMPRDRIALSTALNAFPHPEQVGRYLVSDERHHFEVFAALDRAQALDAAAGVLPGTVLTVDRFVAAGAHWRQ